MQERCKACYDLKHTVPCSYPRCSVSGSVDRCVNVTEGCESVYHHVCLATSRFPAQFSEVLPPRGLCYTCITKTGAQELVPEMGLTNEVVPESPQQLKSEVQVKPLYRGTPENPQPPIEPEPVPGKKSDDPPSATPVVPA